MLKTIILKNKSILMQKANYFLINLFLLIAVWGGLLRRSFNNDTLWHMISPESDIAVQIRDGRFLNALIDYVLLKFGLTTTTHTGVTALAAILCLAAAVCFVQDSFLKKIRLHSIQDQICFVALTNLLFVNVLFSESLFFGECALAFGLAYLFASVGIWLFGRGKYVSAFLFFLAASTGYQISVVYGAIAVTALLYVNEEGLFGKKTIKRQLIGVGITFGSGLVNMMSTSILLHFGLIEHLRKAAGIGNLGDKLTVLWENYLKLLKNSMGLLPGLWLPLLFLAALVVLGIIGLRNQKKKQAYAYFIVMAIVINGMIYAVPFLQAYSYLPPRIVWVFYVVQSTLGIVVFAAAKGKWRQGLCYMACGYLLLQIMFGNIIVSERRISNTLDETFASMAYEKILQYEKETGIVVTGIAAVNDEDSPHSYQTVSYKAEQVNERALNVVNNTLMRVVTGREFKKVEMDDTVYEQYFKGKDWKYFDAEEQIVIIGETAYWAIF